MRIGVVIPTWNEAQSITRTLDALGGEGRPESLVVADCASDDGTAEIARRAGATVVHVRRPNCRAAALEAGWRWLVAPVAERAGECEGVSRLPAVSQDGGDQCAADLDVIWFVHADSIPPDGWRAAIETTLAEVGGRPPAVAGAFGHRFAARDATFVQKRLLRFVQFVNRCRYGVTGIFFGDQGIFVRPAALERIGGIPPMTLLEDVALCRRLREIGPVRLVTDHARMTTSPRRFLRHGILRQFFCDWLLLLTHAARLRLPAVHTLHAWYNREKA